MDGGGRRGADVPGGGCARAAFSQRLIGFSGSALVFLKVSFHSGLILISGLARPLIPPATPGFRTKYTPKVSEDAAATGRRISPPGLRMRMRAGPRSARAWVHLMHGTVVHGAESFL